MLGGQIIQQLLPFLGQIDCFLVSYNSRLPVASENQGQPEHCGFDAESKVVMRLTAVSSPTTGVGFQASRTQGLVGRGGACSINHSLLTVPRHGRFHAGASAT